MKKIFNLIRDNYWEIPDVSYHGKNNTYLLYENLTPPRDIFNLSKIYEKNKRDKKPYPANSILTFSILERIAENGKKEEKNFVEETFKKLINTFSIVVYDSEKIENDRVVHNPLSYDEYSIQSKTISYIGGWIDEINDPHRLRSLLGIADKQRIREVLNHLNIQNLYLNNSLFSRIEKGIIQLGRYPGTEKNLINIVGERKAPSLRVLKLD